MNGRIAATLALGLRLLLVLVAAHPAKGQDAKAEYATRAAIDLYLAADRNAEIALARSAAPASISGGAKILVLEKDGYRTASEGTNGFTCLVERAWMSPVDSPEFWNPKMRGPICYNPPAVRTILPYTIFRTNMVLAGMTKAQLTEKIKAALARKQLPTPEPGAMSYMMSRDGNLGDSVGHWHPHLMFHIPKTEGASWGANQTDSPVMLNEQFRDVPEPETIFMVAVDHWSDGTPAAEASASH